MASCLTSELMPSESGDTAHAHFTVMTFLPFRIRPVKDGRGTGCHVAGKDEPSVDAHLHTIVLDELRDDRVEYQGAR